jgi:hypothetical protein
MVYITSCIISAHTINLDGFGRDENDAVFHLNVDGIFRFSVKAIGSLFNVLVSSFDDFVFSVATPFI